MYHITPLIAVILILLICACACSAGDKTEAKDVQKGFLMKTVKVDGKDFKYVVYIPASYDAAKPMPAIVFLNGMGECGSDGLKQIAQGLGTAVMFNPEKWPFLIVFPQKQNIYGNWEDEDDMVMAALEKTQKEYNIDKSRIYLTGISQGGHGTWAIGSMHTDLFAAIAPVCGWGDEEMAKKLVGMPVWVFHGDKDEAVPVERSYEMEKHLKAAGGSCKMTIYPGINHNSWDKAYREENLYEWFLQHRK